MEDDILIDNYLKGLLSENERNLFIVRLESDTDFTEKFKLEEQLFNTLNEESWSFAEQTNSEVNDYAKLLREDDLQNLKKTLNKANSEFNSNKEQPSKRIFYYLAAASIVVFLGFQFFFNQTISNQDLYNEYVALNDLPSFASRSDGVNQLIEAQILFENKKYEDALVIFNSLKEEQEFKGPLIIYKGISQTELGNYKEAEDTFNSLINSNLLDAEKGYWYKALLFLKADRVEETKELLEKIVSETLYKNPEAKALLEEIKN